MTTPILAFADYTKPFLLETDASKDGLGAVLSQKQMNGWYHPVTYGSRALMSDEKNYHSTKPEFLTLKWVVTEHFKEYLPCQPFLVKTNNNDGAEAQRRDPVLSAVLDWLEAQKKTELKTLLGEHASSKEG